METGSRIGVLHVISGLGLGGAERMLVWSARYHDRNLIRMGVVSLMSGGELADEILREDVEVYELGQARGRLSPSSFTRLMNITKEFDPQVIQGHMYHSNLLVRIAGGLRRQTRVLSTRHIDLASPARRFINGATGFLNDGTLVFSQKVLDEERKENLFRRSIKLVQYGVEIPDRQDADREPGEALEDEGRGELREDLKIPPDAFVWTAVGRLSRQKGFACLIDAFSKIENLGEGSFLLIVGDGEDRGMLEDRAREKGVDQRVIFSGFRPDTMPLLGISDAFVLSSLWEGGPLVILEAMAAGLPVVSTRVGDAASMVTEGVTGTLVEPGDAGQLAEAMNQVQSMGSDIREWGLRGRRRVEEHYDFRRVQGEMETYYQELAGVTGPVQKRGISPG
ncbi:MAG: glycosyltransferase [bacterium]|nr:glycosyltransferase [bacterium]